MRIKVIYDSSEYDDIDDGKEEIIEKSPTPLSILMEEIKNHDGSSNSSRSNRFLKDDDDNACMMHDGQILTDSWERELNMDEIIEFSDVPPSPPPPLRPNPPSVPRPSTSKPSQKKSIDNDILIPDDEYDKIISNHDLDTFIL